AYYDPLAERIIVRGTEMSPTMEATLVHELVHVAQDQAFDLESGLISLDPAAGDAYRALVEGDANRIMLAYVESLDPGVQQAIEEDTRASVEEAEVALGDVPPALQAVGAAPYALGQPLVDLIAADGGNRAVDRAFSS